MERDEKRNGIPTRELGSTGERVTIIGVGGFHIGSAGRPLGVRIIRQAIDEGVNFCDNAWCYHRGESERIMGEALGDGYRGQVFLMTKNHGRDGDTFRTQLEESLRRLQTDVIDLVQFHDLRQPNEPARILHGGALEAAIAAREEGKLRFIGFTGHYSPDLHAEMLAHPHPWDAVQMPINVRDAEDRSFACQILPILRARGIGAIGMKSLAGGRLLRAGFTPEEALGYALSQPIDVLVTGIDSLEILSQNLRIARAFHYVEEGEQEALIGRAEEADPECSLEYYKAS